jgi:hypothetical protein
MKMDNYNFYGIKDEMLEEEAEIVGLIHLDFVDFRLAFEKGKIHIGLTLEGNDYQSFIGSLKNLPFQLDEIKGLYFCMSDRTFTYDDFESATNMIYSLMPKNFDFLTQATFGDSYLKFYFFGIPEDHPFLEDILKENFPNKPLQKYIKGKRFEKIFHS